MAWSLDQAARATGLEVRFVAFQADRDGALHEWVADAMSSTVTTSRPQVGDVVEEVARGRVVVAIRYHALVASVLGGRPAVSLGYDPKVVALAVDVGAGVVGLAWSRSAVAELPGAVDKTAGIDPARVDEARSRLRTREGADRVALERLVAGGRR